MKASKNYPYAYNNLRDGYAEIKTALNNISGVSSLDNLKSKTESIIFTKDLSELRSVYFKLKELQQVFIDENLNLKEAIQKKDTGERLDASTMQLKTTKFLIDRYQQDLNSFLKHIRMDFPDQIQENVDLPDIFGKTLLMYATIDQNQKAIDSLMGQGANPFKEDKYGNSAFSIAINHGNEDLARLFAQKLGDIFNSDSIDADKKGFFHYIAVDISQDWQKYGFDDENGARTCFFEATRNCEALGQDASDLIFS